MLNLSLKLFQGLFGLLIFTTAIGKLLDNRGFAEVIATYEFGLPETVLLPLALSVSLVELALALFITKSKNQVLCGQFVLAMHVGYTVLALSSILRGLELQNCGCFGVFLARPLSWQTVAEDSILTALSVVYWLLAKKCHSRGAPHG